MILLLGVNEVAGGKRSLDWVCWWSGLIYNRFMEKGIVARKSDPVGSAKIYYKLLSLGMWFPLDYIQLSRN